MLADPGLTHGELSHVDHRRPMRTRVLVAAVLLLGVFFRFHNIDRQLYWNDEVFTSLRIAGYQVAEIDQELRDKGIVSVAEMQKYQIPSPQKTVRDTISGLIKEEPQHVPLYFVLARQWVQWFGNSTSVLRSFSAVLSLLALPCVYWLCRELFECCKVGWFAVALFSISPVQIVFGQEARPYSLFVLMVLLSSVALLRAIRLSTGVSWALYGVTVVLGLYTQILFGMVAVGHALYVFASSRFRIDRVSICYVVASGLALATFVPWIRIIFSNTMQNVGWTHTHQSVLASTIRWSGIVSRTFLDLGISPGDALRTKLSVMPLVALVLLLIAYSIYFLVRNARTKEWLFVVTLIASVALPLFVMDLALSRRYGTTRFILSSSIGIQLSVAYLLAMKTTILAKYRWRGVLWRTVAALLVVAGTVSCAARSERDLWWNKVPDDYGDYPQIANTVNQVQQPLIYCYGHWRLTQMICHRLKDDVRLGLLSDDQLPQLSSGFDNVFLFSPTEVTRSNVENFYDVRVEQTHGPLWKIVRQ